MDNAKFARSDMPPAGAWHFEGPRGNIIVWSGPDRVCFMTSNGPARRNAQLIAAAPDLYAALDPDTLEAIADEIDCFAHSARASGLRGIAKRQRAAIARAEGKQNG